MKRGDKCEIILLRRSHVCSVTLVVAVHVKKEVPQSRLSCDNDTFGLAYIHTWYNTYCTYTHTLIVLLAVYEYPSAVPSTIYSRAKTIRRRHPQTTDRDIGRKLRGLGGNQLSYSVKAFFPQHQHFVTKTRSFPNPKNAPSTGGQSG